MPTADITRKECSGKCVLVSLDEYSVLLVIVIDYKIPVQLEAMSKVFKTELRFIRCYC